MMKIYHYRVTKILKNLKLWEILAIRYLAVIVNDALAIKISF